MFNGSISAAAFRNVKDNPPALRHMTISHCAQITDDALFNLHPIAPTLESFQMSTNQRVTPDGVVSLLRKARNLHSLDLSAVDGLTDEAMDEIFHSCKKIQKLHVNGSQTQWGDTALFSVAAYLKDLTHLRCNFNRNITLQGVRSVVLECRKLEVLYLIGCSQLVAGGWLRSLITRQDQELWFEGRAEIEKIVGDSPDGVILGASDGESDGGE
ncbi:hypothetical protein HDV00_009303 [Rhizophlyctis rosea]|nr:hypothetical protein HDV00_009303 [Rhizophlyctis rosea]